MTHSRGDQSPVIGLAGLGDMGLAMAETLMRSGWTVFGFDIVADRLEKARGEGVQPVESLRELAAAAPIVAVVVDGAAALGEVMDELISSAPAGRTLIVHTTAGPADIVGFAAAAARRSIDVVDAAVGGGSEKARLGIMTLLVGGSDAAVERCLPGFEALAEDVFRLGPAGAGMAAKLMNNVLGITSYAMLVEAMKFAAAYGMDEDVAIGVIIKGWGDSRHARSWGRQDRRRRERIAADAGAYTRMSRDLRAAVSAAEDRGVSMGLTSAAAELLPDLLRARDEQAVLHPKPPVPRCAVCNIELAAPYWDAGVHPECRDPRTG